MNPKQIFSWLKSDVIFFIAINVVLIAIFKNRLSGLMYIDLFRLVVLALAVYRLGTIFQTTPIVRTIAPGIWLATILVYAYGFWPVPMFIIVLIFALSALERIISAIISVLKPRA